MKSVDIYFNDLTPEAQDEVLKAASIKDPKERNWDINIIPLATLDFEDEDEGEVFYGNESNDF